MTYARTMTPLAALIVLLLVPTARAAEGDEFYLKDGDRVVFYGDSITDQRLYTTFVETYAVTRFPDKTFTFIHSGWGGDRVTGGAGGPVDRRLRRDVFAYGPTVMTVMLGMNDGSYQSFKDGIFNTYARGYEHILDSVKEHVPGIRLTLIVPSPYDDVTRKPNFEGGYNEVLLKYGEFVKDLAKKEGCTVADLNTSVVEATKKAFESNPKDAVKLNPDRVHPAPAGQLLMAAALLKAWKAPALVSRVSIEVKSGTNGPASTEVNASNAKVSDVKAGNGTLAWTQLDKALPFPINTKDPVVELAVQSSDVVSSLDNETLEVDGLPAGDYTLKIDGQEVGTYPADRLAGGLNLALEPTPMAAQAQKVHELTLKHTSIHQTRWRNVQVPFEKETSYRLMKAMEELDAYEAEVVKEQRTEAKPKSRTFALTRKAG